ncbi:amidohydrolase family protein [Sulfitobacter mediterraneus]|uniref:metal-dependent hydrolase family protein n=1 Tax=Sulfitobacter mediterraneus TaxID=83219 RepID=UPI001931EBBA|nr:amidohydrolase family protein [Sulfitobacter mediterraneus]MBM1633043.1 amidohydrolase family protein [Sulfitobacter mediterraneus]MBM1640823.1 amidohydrolase family protein [Sulfitobacter mediterraneus]MBM1644908.1 amidohydrolase family protein [Sulfitobacter mediterraneus]MBM1648943.1 amidohydrolase family protein [Sulfitobacter mediterraneus]MBM1652964.1 amidohydrolase family protein [Sulfitobacter mediterraneus]
MNTQIIKNGRVIDGTGAKAIDASVLIEEGVITAVGGEADAKAAQMPGIREIDATGQTVMPGLVDTHCHLSFDDAGSNAEIFHQRRNALSALVASYNGRKLLRAGVTSVLDPDSVHENMIDLRDAIDANIVEGPRMSCGSYALITGVGGTAGRLIKDEGVTGYYLPVNSRDEIVREVRRQIKYGADWIKVHVTGIVPRQAHLGELCVWTLDELKLICDTAHELRTPVMGHCRGAEATRRAAVAGFDLIFHATAIDDAALQEIIDRKIPITPALTFQANMVDYGHKIGTSSELMKIFESEITDSIDTMTKAHKEGVPLMCGSEAGFSLVPYGDWHYREMEVFVKYFGLTPLEAIKCGTMNGAIGMRMEGEIGVIAPGYKADIICVTGKVEEDLSLLGNPDNITRVMIGGVEKNIDPLPERKNISGWRLASIGSTRLTRAVALGQESTPEAPNIEELH